MFDEDGFDDEPEKNKLTVELTDTVYSELDEARLAAGYTSREEFARQALRDAIRAAGPADSDWDRTEHRSKGDPDQHSDDQKAARQMRLFLLIIILAIIFMYTLFTRTNPLIGVLTAAVVYWVFKIRG
jgi:Arc/MetJ-type ribon-helix-helix transcriptional regulator